MLELQQRAGRFYYGLFRHPVARVMKFEKFASYFSELPNGGTVLDYGSGDRPLEPMLAGKFDRYIAADYPATNAAHARRPDVVINTDGLDLPDESVECVVLTEVLEHLYEPKLVLQEIHRLLKPGGTFIGTVPFAMNEHEQPYDFHRYTFFCLKTMFEKTGFEIRRIEYVGDNVGVAIATATRVVAIIPKTLHRLGFRRLATATHSILRVPEALYYGAVKIGLDPGRLPYYRDYPFGFSFCAAKPWP